MELISQALVEAYIQMDKDLLLLEESGLMVCQNYITVMCL